MPSSDSLPPGSSCLYRDPAHYTRDIPAIILDPMNKAHVAKWGRIAVEEIVTTAEALGAISVWIQATLDVRSDRASAREVADGRPERLAIVLPEMLRPLSRPVVVKNRAAA